MQTFLELGVRKTMVQALKELKIINPTAVQEKVIPTLLQESTDFVGLAQTGTGKTAAYGLPLLQKINPSYPEVQVLVLSPTRELVQQIKKQLFKFTKYETEKIFVEAVFGGEKIDIQIKNLQRTTHVIVATPGRLIDLINRDAVDLQKVKTVVLDEADEMLSMGFKEELNSILRYTNKQSKKWLFSATMPEAVQRIIKNYMNPNCPKVEINKARLVNANITHQYIKTTLKEKLDTLVALLERKGDERGIIFCKTKAGVQSLAEKLNEEGFSVGALEGNMQQRDREKAMRAFKNERLQILISTDVAARGIDVQDLAYIIHYQLPEKSEYYTHRSGRTARAGKKGYSIALILPNELEQIHALQKALNISFKAL